MTRTSIDVVSAIEQALRRRNEVQEAFFAREAPRLAAVCFQMAERFRAGGRLLAFGVGPYATDAQHVAVEFVHPVIVGKRALPALDVSMDFSAWIDAGLREADIVMGFGPPDGHPAVRAALEAAGSRGAMTFALPGSTGSYAVAAASTDPFIHQETIELLYHTLWESVHVFLEQRELGQNAGASGFLYPFLGDSKQDAGAHIPDVAASIRMKVEEDAKLRMWVALTESALIAQAAEAMRARVRKGGKLILFGNGGSATDANDWMIDCIHPPEGWTRIPAVSLACEPATLTAIANDVDVDVMFLRQLIAHAQKPDVAVAISTSGGSRNVVAALGEARSRGLLTVALVGGDGGEIVRRALADIAIVVRADDIPRIQEVQASIYHILRETMEQLGHA